MSAPKSIGFPRMRCEIGEKRVFLPEFIHHLVQLGAQVYIEEGYGARSGFSFEDYKRANPNIHMTMFLTSWARSLLTTSTASAVSTTMMSFSPTVARQRYWAYNNALCVSSAMTSP